MEALIDTNHTQELSPSSTDQQLQDMSIDSSFQTLHPPSVTTILTPLNVRQRVKTTRKPHDQSVSKHKLNSTVTTHRIGDWTIRESLRPFPHKQNKPSSIKQEQQVPSNKSNVLQWNIDDVCLFFEHILGTNCYTPILQEHLIDGFALLLLKDEHLINIFRMQLESRIQLLKTIKKLKPDDLS